MLSVLFEVIINAIAVIVGPPENKKRSPWVQALMEVGCGLVFLLFSIGALLLVMALF